MKLIGKVTKLLIAFSWVVYILLLPMHAVVGQKKGAIEADTSEMHTDILQLWDNSKKRLAKGIRVMNDRSTMPLYYLQQSTANLFIYATNTENYELLDDIAKVYLEAADKLNAMDSTNTAARAWLANGKESILTSAQFLNAASKMINRITMMPKEAVQECPHLSSFIEVYAPIVISHYQRWVFEEEAFTVSPWGCSKQRMNHYELVKAKINQELGDRVSYCNVVLDVDLWIISGVLEIIAAKSRYPDRIGLSDDQLASFKEYTQVGFELIEGILQDTKIKDFDGNEVTGVAIQPGAWTDHPDYQYAADTSISTGITPSKGSVEGISWDISHARRWVHILESMLENKHHIGSDFPDNSTMEKFANQVVYKIFNGNFEYPLFSNYFDGTNGWYRVNYSRREGFGYRPYDLSKEALTSGFFFWSKYNADLARLQKKLLEVIQDKDKQEHIDNYYGTYYMGYKRVANIDIDKKGSLDLLQFLPTFYPK